ncbi:MAG: hypothetical protein ACYC3S_01950 [Chloroflexota bacterium]
MLNRSWQLKVLWVCFGGLLILIWAASVFLEAGTGRVLGATAGMLVGVVVVSINAAALIEDIFHAWDHQLPRESDPYHPREEGGGRA